MWLYSDYIKVDEDFIPVYTKDQDTKRPGAWKSFIPHQPMINILDKLIRALGRESDRDNWSIWVNGAYGTGKTYGAFVVKHLLEDPIEEVDEYFEKYKTYIGYLKDKFIALRSKGKYLVVYTSSSSHITSPFTFILGLQKNIEERLKEKELFLPYGETLVGSMLKKISGPDSTFNWEKAFYKYRTKFMDYSDPDEVINDLLKISVDMTEADLWLLQTVYEILQNEGISIVADSDTFISWLKEVFEVNKGKLSSILFIWDEFTDYFNNNISLTTLQEIAHATKEIPFYLFLITHRTLEEVKRYDEESRKKVAERFHNINFEMKPVTAYQLIGNAISPKTDKTIEWENKKESLWSKIARIRRLDVFPEIVKDSDLKNLMPIHPYAAYLLSFISQQFNSSERTLFKFLTDATKDYSFPWFIRNYPTERVFLYTADMLWNYFFTDTDEILIDNIRDIISHYQNHIGSLTAEKDKAVFKALLLLMSLERGIRSSDVIAPKTSVLRAIFMGTDIEHEIDTILERLYTLKIINVINHGSESYYTLPLLNVDFKKIEDIKKDMESRYPFNALSQENHIGGIILQKFVFSSISHMRQKLNIVSAESFKIKKELVIPKTEPYEVACVVIIGKDEAQLFEAQKVAADLSQKELPITEKCIFLIVDFPFSEKRYNEWLEHKAHARYYKEELKDTRNADAYEKRALDVVKNWLDIIVNHGKFNIFYKGENIRIEQFSLIEKKFINILDRIYPHRPERYFDTATLYTSTYGKKTVEYGLGSAKIQGPCKDIYTKLEGLGLWDDMNWYKKKPDYFMSHMMREIEDEFFSSGKIDLVSVWEKLEGPPYGLMPSPIACFIMGFLFKKYVEGYYWYDGFNSHKLNPNSMAELIEKVIKGRISHTVQINKVSEEEERLCEYLANIFQISMDYEGYLKDIRKAARERIKKTGYPLWVLKYSVSDERVKNAIDTLNDFICQIENDEIIYSDSNIKKVLNDVENHHLNLKDIFNHKINFDQGLINFIKENNNTLYSLISIMDIISEDVLERLQLLLNEDVWLWTESTVKSKLVEVYAEYKMLHSLNELMGINEKSLVNAIKYLKSGFISSKIPFAIFANIPENTASSILKEIDNLFSKNVSHGYKIELAEKIILNKDIIRNHVKEDVSALSSFIDHHIGKQLSLEEVAILLQRLPNEFSSENSLDSIKAKLKDIIGNMEVTKLFEEVKEKWFRISGFYSPKEWSKFNKIPIRLILKGDSAKLLNKLNRLQYLSESELRELLVFMEEKEEEIKKLLENSEVINEIFLKTFANKFSNLVRLINMEHLKNYIYNKAQVDVEEWPYYLADISKLVEEFVMEKYEKDILERLMDLINNTPEYKIKNLIKELINDPVIGDKLLCKLIQ